MAQVEPVVPTATSATPTPAPTAALEAGATAEAATPVSSRPRNRIQVSREKRPLYFFISLAKKFLVTEDEVELSGLGLAVTTVVTVAEILKNTGYITISKIETSLVEMRADGRNSATPKAKIQIWIRKSANFDQLTSVIDNTKRHGNSRNAKYSAKNGSKQSGNANATPTSTTTAKGQDDGGSTSTPEANGKSESS